MDDGAPHHRLRRARVACGEELQTLSRRTGIRVHHLRAIEAGRFADLPPGIYARAAVRSFAQACGLDPASVLADCEALLPHVDDPVSALARKCGVRPAATPQAAAGEQIAPLETSDPDWRTLAAIVLDAAFVGALLMGIVASMAVLLRVPIAALGQSAIPLTLVGIVLGSGYFLWFGGLCGTTPGGFVVHGRPPAGDREPLTLRAIAARAVSAATEDARAILWLGSRLGQGPLTPGGLARTVRRLARALSRLRPPDLGQARWSPASRPAVGPPQPLHRPRV